MRTVQNNQLTLDLLIGNAIKNNCLQIHRKMGGMFSFVDAHDAAFNRGICIKPSKMM